MARPLLDLGDVVTGRVVRDDGSGHFPLVWPKAEVTGEVIGVYPNAPTFALVRDGEEIVVIKVYGTSRR